MSFVQDQQNYGSELSDTSSEASFRLKKKLNKDDDIFRKPYMGHLGLLHHHQKAPSMPSKRSAADMLDVEEGKRMRYHQLLTLDAFNRHKKMVNDYLTLYGGKLSDIKRDSSKDKSDLDVIYTNHKFLWDEVELSTLSWEERLAKKYWDKLYKEYAICDLSLFKENKIGFRWRTEKEVVSGKGQFSCCNKKCFEKSGLRSWEVNFAYHEDDEMKNALVKARLCAECSHKLNFHHKRKDVTGKSNKRKQIKENQTLKRKEKRKKGSKKKKRSKDEAGSSKSAKSASDESDEDVWKKPKKIETEKTREDEFDEYFSGMFL